MTDFCPHCRCDEDHGEHGPNCPRYRGPSSSELDIDARFQGVEQRLDALEGKLETEPFVEFEGTLRELNISVLRFRSEIQVYVNGERVQPRKR